MGVVAFAVVAGWAVLIGTAYMARVVWRFGRVGSGVAVALAYLACAASALAWLGTGAAGGLGAFGLLLPCAVAMAMACLRPPGSIR